MNLDYRWEIGDRCFVDGHIAQISKIVDSHGTRFAKLWREDGTSMFCPLQDLELVPMSERATLPAMPVASEGEP